MGEHVEVELTKFERWLNDGVEDGEVLPPRSVPAGLEFYHFKWNVAYTLSMAPHKIRLWKLLKVVLLCSALIFLQGNEDRYARVQDGWGLVEETKGITVGDLLAPGETKLQMLIEKKNVNDRWVWTGEDANGNKLPPPIPHQNSPTASQHRLLLGPSPRDTNPEVFGDDFDDDMRKAILLSLQSAQVVRNSQT